MLYYLVRLLFSGELLYFSVGVGIISLCKYIHFYFNETHNNNNDNNKSTVVLLLKKSIGMSKISKGSSYGTHSPKKIQ